MSRTLDDFIYSLETMETYDLAAYGLDDAWLADLTEEELIAFIHEAISRFPEEDDPYMKEWEDVPEEEEYEE